MRIEHVVGGRVGLVVCCCCWVGLSWRIAGYFVRT